MIEPITPQSTSPDPSSSDPTPLNRTTLRRRTFLRLGAVGAGAAALSEAIPLGWSPSTAAAAPVSTTQHLPLGPSTYGMISGDILAFDPENDYYAPYFRSRIPRATRIKPYQPAQAHPDLAPQTQLMLLDGDYRCSAYDMRPAPYDGEPHVYTHRYWAYTDIWGSWHGQVFEQYDDAQLAAGEDLRYGVFELPAVGWVDAAHRHGALAIANWFWPRSKSEYLTRMIQRAADGSFPVADKLIEMRKYFGWDGMFLNQEGRASDGLDTGVDDIFVAKEFREFIAYIKTKDPDFYLQWYDALDLATGRVKYLNRITKDNLVWIDGREKPAADSMFINYWWSQDGLRSSRDVVAGAGLDPYRTAYAGIEAQQGWFNPIERMDDLAKPGLTSPLSFALFVPSEFWNTLNKEGKVDTPTGRAAARALEQQYWSGPTGNPATSGRQVDKLPRGRTDIANPKNWSGVAHSITERSSVSSLPVGTSFDIGVGDSFSLAGAPSRTTGWNNLSAASLQPTWQYWTLTEGATEVSAAIDPTVAWEGGASVRLAGTLPRRGHVELRLFKTDLARLSTLTAKIHTRSWSGSHRVELGLVFSDDPQNAEWFALSPTVVGRGWREWNGTVAKAQIRGRRVVATGLRVQANAAGKHELSVGSFVLSDAGKHRPSTPRSFRAHAPGLEKGKALAHFSWRYDPKVLAWDVLQVLGNGRRVWLGRIHNDVFFSDQVKAASRQTATFELVAIGHDLSRSVAGTASLRF